GLGSTQEPRGWAMFCRDKQSMTSSGSALQSTNLPASKRGNTAAARLWPAAMATPDSALTKLANWSAWAIAAWLFCLALSGAATRWFGGAWSLAGWGDVCSAVAWGSGAS